MAGRADMSRATIDKIERGDPITSIGGYVSVLFLLGMTDRLNDLVDSAHDLIGRRLEDEKLPKRVRMPNRKKMIIVSSKKVVVSIALGDDNNRNKIAYSNKRRGGTVKKI